MSSPFESDEEMDDGMDEEIDDGIDWDEEEEDQMIAQPTRCLFCEEMLEGPEALFSHCKQAHEFDVKEVVLAKNLDSIGYIKMINYIRKTKSSAEDVCRLYGEPPWLADEYMMPVDPEDPLLQYDIDDLELLKYSSDNDNPASCQNCAAGGSEGIDNPVVTIPRAEWTGTLERLKQAENRANQAEEQLRRAVQDLEHMKSVTRDLVMSQARDVNVSQNSVEDLNEDEDEAYFSSYAHFSIHEEMLKDEVRTESYRDFMYKNSEVFKDKVVLDVGCGTGILSMFAATAGASQVIAVDQSEIIYQAMDIARENSLSDKITFLKGRLEDVKLPVEKVDIIISEWMGYFLLFESMLDTVLTARDRYLKPGGVVYPDRCTLRVAAICDLDLHQKHVTYWDDVYGFQMGCMKSVVVREASVEIVRENKVGSTPALLQDLDICSCSVKDLQFSKEFEVTMTTDGPITGIVGYFDIYFEKNCSEKINFSTSPAHTPTHWKQTIFLFDKPMEAETGDQLKGQLTCRKKRGDPRSLLMTLMFNGHHYNYIME